jgi:hypothetical protein
VIGIVFIGLGSRPAGSAVRIERGRATARIAAAQRPPLSPAPGRLARILQAEFASESRWRDVLYVGVNLPLAIIEFAVIGGLWSSPWGS